MKLNGWRRLWILIGCISFIPIMLFIILPDIFLQNKHIYASWYGELFSYVKAEDQITYDDTHNEGSILFLEEELNKKNLNEYQNNIIDIRNKYSKELTNNNIKYFTLELIVFWVIPLILIYILGWSIGWVYRGFKKR